jgi:hypothetical protein
VRATTCLLPLLAVLMLASSAGADPGVLSTSDGHAYEGDITWTRGKPLKLFDSGANKWYRIQAGSVLRIRSVVTREDTEKAWVWVEDGRQEKIYTGETYPVREVVTEITLRSGAVFRGECRAVLHVRDAAGKKKRFFLKSRWKGEKGQKQTDIVHVARVRFEGTADAPGNRPSLLLKISGLKEIQSVHAIERANDLHFSARKTSEGWLLAGLIPGKYDVAVVAKEGVRLWMQADFKGKRRSLKPEDEAAVAARVSEIEDFFPQHRTLAAFGTRKKVRALVLKKRLGATSMSKEGERLFRRLEVWTLHHHGERWYVDGIVMLYREHGDPFDLEHPRPVEEDSRLGGLAVATGRSVVDLKLGEPPPREDSGEADGEDR